MSTTTQAIEIPALKKDDKVEEWGKQYLAATALLNAEQRPSLFPMYAGKHASEGEKSMIEIAANQGDIKKALEEFEILRDGEPHKLSLIDRYYKMEPLSIGLKSFFFELLHVGRKAEISPYMILLRFLSLCPRGKKLFDDNKTSISEDMTETQAVALYKKIAPKLKDSGGSSDIAACQIKEEEQSTFLASEMEMPEWAKKLSEEVHGMRRTMESQSSLTQSDEQSESDNETWYVNNRPTKSGKNFSKSSLVCRSCDKVGHKAIDCFTKCYTCKGSGHSSKVCPTKKGKGKFKPNVHLQKPMSG